MYDRIRALSSLDRLYEASLAAFVLRVRNNHQCFSACFGAEFLRASEVNGIIKMRAAGARRDCSGSDHSAAADRVHLGFVDGALDDVLVIREIREQVNIEIKA